MEFPTVCKDAGQEIRPILNKSSGLGLKNEIWFTGMLNTFISAVTLLSFDSPHHRAIKSCPGQHFPRRSFFLVKFDMQKVSLCTIWTRCIFKIKARNPTNFLNEKSFQITLESRNTWLAHSIFELFRRLRIASSRWNHDRTLDNAFRVIILREADNASQDFFCDSS